MAELFLNTKDPKRIIEKLSLANGKKINPNTTLIIFDEIQECTNALNSLKYFCEEASEYHVVCAGSLLGIRLSKTSFPIGKVDFLDGNRLFEEFKGSFTENYVANTLNYLLDESPNYYTFDRKKIDFVIQVNNEMIPIEVKANKSTNHNSLTKYNVQNDNKISFRFSLNNLNKDGKIINIPLYFIEYIKELNLDE